MNDGRCGVVVIPRRLSRGEIQAMKPTHVRVKNVKGLCDVELLMFRCACVIGRTSLVEWITTTTTST